MHHVADSIQMAMAGTPGRILILLLASHVIGDFLFQTEALASRKREHGGLMLLHGVLVLVAHWLVLWPYLSAQLIGWTCVIAGAHVAQDSLRGRGVWPEGLRGLCLDQLVHILIAVVVWGALFVSGALGELGFVWGVAGAPLHLAVVVIASGYAVCWTGGATIVATLLNDQGLGGPDGAQVGRAIGIAERVAVFTLGMVGQWVAVGLVIAAKSIRAPRDSNAADYYLLGTLVSVLLAVLAALAVRTLLGS